MEYIKFLDSHNITYEEEHQPDNWYLKNEKMLLKKGEGQCYDTSYCAWKHFPGSFRIWMIELNHLTDEDIDAYKQKKYANTNQKGGMTHTICVYKENDKFVWWEYSWKNYRGVHRYSTLDKLLDDIAKKWETTGKKYKKLMMTKITGTKVGCNIDEYIDRGFFSKILKVYDI